MFNDFRVVCAAVGLAIVTAGAPAVAQFAPPGSERYVGEQQAPPAGEIWADDDDDDDVAPPAQQPGQLTGPPPPFFLPPPAPFFATPAERPPVTAYEPGLTSRGYERDAPPRPPGSIDRDVQQPNQAPGRAPTAAPRPSPSNLASLPPEEQPEQASKELPPQFKRQLVNYETTRAGRHHRHRYGEHLPLSRAGRRQSPPLRHRGRARRFLLGRQPNASAAWPNGRTGIRPRK